MSRILNSYYFKDHYFCQKAAERMPGYQYSIGFGESICFFGRRFFLSAQKTPFRHLCLFLISYHMHPFMIFCCLCISSIPSSAKQLLVLLFDTVKFSVAVAPGIVTCCRAASFPQVLGSFPKNMIMLSCLCRKLGVNSLGAF